MPRPRIGTRRRRARRRLGSKIAILTDWVLPHVREWKCGPTLLALLATHELGFPVTKQEIYEVLVGEYPILTRKVSSIAPSLSDPDKRLQYLTDLENLVVFY
tara:strand:+ start:223 stop:528 length:306 start_codon:yes stop_codon:yes gene_type:complete